MLTMTSVACLIDRKTLGVYGCMKKVVLCFLVFVLLMSGCANTNSYREATFEKLSASGPVELTPADYVAEVEVMIEAIDKLYAHRNIKGVTAQGLRDAFLPRVQRAKNMSELNPILLEMFASLQNGHSNVFTQMNEFGVHMGCALIDNQLVVTRVGYSPLIDHGVAPGWVLKSVEGRPALEWIEDKSRFISASTQHNRTRGAVDRAFLRYEFEPEMRNYELVSPLGEIKSLAIPLNIHKNDLRSALARAPIETLQLGNIGYIAINTMADGIVARFDQALSIMLDKSGLVIDLRNNGGGNSVNGDEMVRRLIQSKTAIWGGRTIHPYNKLNYAGDIVVLVSSSTFSAAESFAFSLYDSGRVVVIGEPTAGDSGGGPKLFTTPKGIFFRFPTRGVDRSASGLAMEGVGLQPHIFLKQTLDDILSRIDGVLDFSIEYLKNSTS